MTHSAPDFESVMAASERLAGHAVRTPLLRSDDLDAACGCKVLVKAEPLQKGNAFKYRGARNRLSQLSSEQCNTGVVAFSSGNHAIGVAISAKELSIPAIIVMPEDAPKVKIEKVLSYGAEIRFYDRLKESREDIASEISKTSGRVLVPSYDDVHIISGQGTIGIEIAEQAPDAASVIVCLGGGGMCAGISLALGELRPEMNIYGAEPVDYNDHQLSLARNERVKLIHSPPSICDAIMTPQPGELTWSVNSKFLSAVFTASDDDCLKAMALVKRELDLTVEPGGAVAIASLMAQKPFPLDQTVVALASGGNVDENMLQFALDRY